MSDDTAISRTSTRHAYQQVADAITTRITTGHYTIKLPAERALADEFGVSYITIRHATKILRQRDLIISIHGRGTYIAAALTRTRPQAGPN
jgi:GntR family transcriptional regulator